jgi:hypothetical protein
MKIGVCRMTPLCGLSNRTGNTSRLRFSNRVVAEGVQPSEALQAGEFLSCCSGAGGNRWRNLKWLREVCGLGAGAIPGRRLSFTGGEEVDVGQQELRGDQHHGEDAGSSERRMVPRHRSAATAGRTCQKA